MFEGKTGKLNCRNVPNSFHHFGLCRIICCVFEIDKTGAKCGISPK
jgi:hypothetical protein